MKHKDKKSFKALSIRTLWLICICGIYFDYALVNRDSNLKLIKERRFIMTLVKRNSDRMLPSFFDNFFGRDWMDWNNSNFSNTNTTLPAINVLEDENKYTIEVAAPGMSKSDFNISLNNDSLSISSEKKEEKESKNGNYTRKEFSYQSFHRSFQVPENLVNGDKISAKYEDGILKVVLPKKEEAKPKPARIIKIS